MNEICLQELEKDCGYACLKSLLIHYHHNQNFKYLTDDFKENMSLLDIKETAKKYNLNLQGVELEDKNLIFNNEYSICQMNINNYSHFIVFIQNKKEKVVIIDPRYGKTTVSKTWFLEHFTGYSLIYDSHETFPYKIKFKLGILGYLLIYILSFAIEFSLIYLLSYFLKNDKFFFLVLLSLFGLSLSYASKSLIINGTYNFLDKKIIKLFNKNHKFNQMEINNLLKFKVDLVNLYFGTINYICLFIFICILLIENSVLNLMVILGILFSFFLKEIILKKKKIDKKYILLNTESSLVNNDNSKIKENYEFINKNVNNIIRGRTLFVVVINIISILFCFLINYFHKFESLSYIIFSSFAYILLIERTLSFCESFEDNLNRFNKNKSSFYRLNNLK